MARGDLHNFGRLILSQIVAFMINTGFMSQLGTNCVIGPLGRQGPAATFGQHCPQMAQRPGTNI